MAGDGNASITNSVGIKLDLLDDDDLAAAMLAQGSSLSLKPMRSGLGFECPIPGRCSSTLARTMAR